MSLGSKEDKEQESFEEDIIGLDLNVDHATITYLSYTRSIEETEATLAEFKKIRSLPTNERPEEFKTNETLNPHIQLAQYTLSQLRYLQGEVKLIMIELTPPEENKPKIITKPKWDKS